MPLSAQNTPAVNASTTNTAFFFLLTIRPADKGQEIYLVNNTEPVTSNGITYQPYPFSMSLPLDTGDKIPSIELAIDNVDQLLINAIRELEQAPNLRVQLVTSTFPDLIEKDLDFLRLRNVRYDAMTITGSLEVASVWTRKAIAETVDPIRYPGLFFVVALGVSPLYLEALHGIATTIA